VPRPPGSCSRASERRAWRPGPAVVALEQRLHDLRYAVRDTGGVFDDGVREDVVARQDLNRLRPAGVVTPALRARHGGDHAGVNETRRGLFLVRGG
jgi:hypothetical protein